MGIFIDIAFTLIMLIAIIAVAVSLFYESKTDIASVPTMPWVKKELIKYLRTKLSSGKPYKIAELGSGWGSLAFGLNRAFPKSRIIGYELSPIPYWISTFMNKITGDTNAIRFLRRDFFSEYLGDVNMVIFYLSGRHTIRLKDKLEEELKPGSVVISNSFPVPGWKPVKILTTKVFMELKIYVYVMKDKNNIAQDNA